MAEVCGGALAVLCKWNTVSLAEVEYFSFFCAPPAEFCVMLEQPRFDHLTTVLYTGDCKHKLKLKK